MSTINSLFSSLVDPYSLPNMNSGLIISTTPVKLTIVKIKLMMLSDFFHDVKSVIHSKDDSFLAGP